MKEVSTILGTNSNENFISFIQLHTKAIEIPVSNVKFKPG
ncbi:hypothetical protein CFB3_25570 [Clostridium folliculivorans]|nr:hypothetical protein CFB3_25570 [Clostridium folliculivorans]